MCHYLAQPVTLTKASVTSLSVDMSMCNMAIRHSSTAPCFSNNNNEVDSFVADIRVGTPAN